MIDDEPAEPHRRSREMEGHSAHRELVVGGAGRVALGAPATGLSGPVADVDADGRDEIIYGSMCVDDDGSGLYSTDLRHGDAMHVGDLDPARGGLEVWGIHENEVVIPGYEDGFGAAKLCFFAKTPEGNPFMAGAFLGPGEPGTVVNIGVSGPGVIKRALERLLESGRRVDLGTIAEEIKRTSFRVSRVGELMGREVARKLGVEVGVVDLSLAPTTRIGDSVGESLQTMGIVKIGAPGSTVAVAMLNDAVKKGGLFASSSVGGLSGAFIPVSEDQALSRAVAEGSLTLEKLEAMTSVCSVGLDMVVIPGDVDAETISAIIADEMAIGVINNKTTAVRLIPAAGKSVGEKAVFGGLFGQGDVVDVRNAGTSSRFVAYGGRTPAPPHRLTN